MKTKAGNKFAGILIISILLIAVTVALPLFEVGGGTFNFSSEFGFLDVFKFIGQNGVAVITKSFPVLFTVAAFVPAVLLFLFALLRSKVMCIISSLLGIGCLGYAFYAFSRQATAQAMYFGDMACISIAAWICALLFIIALICSIAVKKEKVEKKA